MEVAVIDWKSIDSRFVSDELYEHISAPQWVDLSAPADPVDDEAWFCRPDCDHPKIVDDFFKQKTPSPSPKVERSSSAEASALEIRPLSERKQRDGKLKKRWEKIGVEDNENRNPNMSTPPQVPNYNKWKEAVKSSAEKTMIVDEHYHHLKEEGKTPKLRRTLSAKTLFGGGGEILNKINEFCNELKKLTTRAKEKEENNEPISQAKEESTRTPLLDKEKEKPRRHKRFDLDDEENTIPSMILTPKPLSIDVKNKRKEQNIRTNPPTPQCFSNGPQKVFKSKPLERGILKELAGHSSSNKEEKSNKIHQHGSIINAEKEAKSVDVFWFLKPCTL